MRKQVVFCLSIMMTISLVSGCAFVKSQMDSYTDADAGIQSSEHDGEDKGYVAPGVLTQVEYSYASGTMMGQDFGIAVSQSEIVSLFYFDEEDHTQKDVTHIPITSDQWKQIEEAVSAITPGLEEVEHQEEKSNWITDHMMQDGGDRTSFALTWEKDGKTTQVYYSTPHDDGYLDLLDILKGMTKYDTTEELENKDDGGL